METEQMIKRLRYLAEEHKNDKVGTCQTRWSDLCSDVADRLEEQTASLKNTFEMPVKIGSCVWKSDDPYEPYFVIGYRIGRMFDEDEEDYEEDYPEPGWYIQLSSDYGDVSTPVSDIGRDFFITQDEALQAREDSEEMKRCR